MNTAFEKMEFCASNATRQDGERLAKTITLLGDENWRVRYAAAIALGDRRDAKAVDALVELLHRENTAPLFAQPNLEGSAPAGSSVRFAMIFPEGTTEATKEAWRRRGRVLQAACLALGNLGEVSPAALELLHRYATDQGCDYAVRAAACKALGQLARPESLPTLKIATSDEEWCTKTEASKALQTLSAGSRT